MKLFNWNYDDVSSFTGFLREVCVFITLEKLLVLSRCLAHSNSKQDVLTVLRYIFASISEDFLTQLFSFSRETQSLDTKQPKRRFTRILLETANPPLGSSETPLP